MRVDLPAPRLPVRVGPPAPPGPTLAEFSKIVEVARGKLNEKPDLLFCDNLRLVLVPAAKPAPADGAKTDGATGDGSEGEPGRRRRCAAGRAPTCPSAAPRPPGTPSSSSPPRRG